MALALNENGVSSIKMKRPESESTKIMKAKRHISVKAAKYEISINGGMKEKYQYQLLSMWLNAMPAISKLSKAINRGEEKAWQNNKYQYKRVSTVPQLEEISGWPVSVTNENNQRKEEACGNPQ